MSSNWSRSVLIILILSCLAGCSSLRRNLSNFFFPPNPWSDRRDGEQVNVELKYKMSSKEVEELSSNPYKSGKEGRMFEPFSMSVIAGIAVSAIGQFLKEEGERYSATYSSAAFGDVFYDNWDKTAALNLQAITVTRTVKGDPALDFCALVMPTIDRTGFQLVPVYLSMQRSKAKLIGFDWLSPLNFDLLAPWTIFKNEWSGYDNDVDVKIRMEFYAMWRDKEGKGHNELIAQQEFSYPNVPLSNTGRNFLSLKKDDGSTSKTCPSLLSLLFEANNDGKKQIDDPLVQEELVRARNAAPLFPAIPRSYFEGEIAGTGNFVVKVLVTEYDKYGERVKEVGTKVESSKEGIVKELSHIAD